jgi:hypothetical protein
MVRGGRKRDMRSTLILSTERENYNKDYACVVIFMCVTA